MENIDLSARLQAVYDSFTGPLKKAEAHLELASKKFDFIRNRYFEAEKNRNGLIMDRYKARLAEAHKYIEEEIKTIHEPERFDEERVNALRKTLDGPDDTYEDRIAKLKALHELSLTVKKFPFAQRVADVLKEWTGREFSVEFNGLDACINYDGVTLMKVDTSPKQYSDDEGKYRNTWGRYTQSTANLLVGRLCHRYRFPTILVEFWEMICGKLYLDDNYLLGEHKPTFGIKEDGYDTQRVSDYCKLLHRIGTTDMMPQATDERRYYTNCKATAETFAGYVIVAFPEIFTVSESFGIWDRLNEYARNELTHTIQDVESALKQGQYHNVEKLAFDRGTMEIKWNIAVDSGVVFDPDTCEMLHPSSTRHSLSVANVVLSEVLEYASTHIDGVSPYGRIKLHYDVSTRRSDEEVTLDDILKLGQDILPSKLKKCIDIVVFPYELSEISWDHNHVRAEFEAVLKVPFEPFKEKYKNYMCNDRTFEMRPEFKLHRLSKLYIKKEDL